MALDYGDLTGQTTGQTIDVSSAQDVHTVPANTTQRVTIQASATATEVLTVKPGGDSTGYTVTVAANEPTVIYNSTVENTTGAGVTINIESAGSTARAWGEFSQLS